MLPLFQGMTKEEERLVRGAIDELRDPPPASPTSRPSSAHRHPDGARRAPRPAL